MRDLSYKKIFHTRSLIETCGGENTSFHLIIAVQFILFILHLFILNYKTRFEEKIEFRQLEHVWLNENQSIYNYFSLLNVILDLQIWSSTTLDLVYTYYVYAILFEIWGGGLFILFCFIFNAGVEFLKNDLKSLKFNKFIKTAVCQTELRANQQCPQISSVLVQYFLSHTKVFIQV